jgi:acetyl esterase/lipase
MRAMITRFLIPICCAATGVASLAQAPATPAPAAPPAAPAPAAKKAPRAYPVVPTVADLSYGPHKKQVLNFWKAESDKPTPLLFYIHGGGWTGGDRTSVIGMLPDCLKAGISVVSVEYRFIAEATADNVVPPVKGPLTDAARALQLVRSKAADWNIDKERIGASGGSAGACTSLWLAFHDDLADPKSSDPVARESTRLWCAAVDGAQTTLDPKQMRDWTPNSKYGGHAFGFKGDPATKLTQFDEFYNKRETILPWIAEYSPWALVTKDDPPIYMNYTSPPAMGKEEKDPTHTANFGVKLQEHCKEAGVPCELMYPGAPDAKHASSKDYLIDKLKSPKT